jgi:hypothetical protein
MTQDELVGQQIHSHRHCDEQQPGRKDMIEALLPKSGMEIVEPLGNMNNKTDTAALVPCTQRHVNGATSFVRVSVEIPQKLRPAGYGLLDALLNPSGTDPCWVCAQNDHGLFIQHHDVQIVPMRRELPEEPLLMTDILALPQAMFYVVFEPERQVLESLDLGPHERFLENRQIPGGMSGPNGQND